MRYLIGNAVNTKGILFNILNNACPNIILLHGEYGLGKTEFAIDVAKMLVCPNLSESGYCGNCETCRTNSFNDSTFLSKISLTNMAKIDKEEVLALVRENVALQHSGNKVYIYDEFHAIPPAEQEMWLSESRHLSNTYLILTTTKMRQVDKGILSRALKLKMSPVSRSDINSLLDMYQIRDLDDEVVSEMYITLGGIPRDLVIMGTYLMNSKLSLEEQLQTISSYKKAPLLDLLFSMGDKICYFRGLKDLFSAHTDEQIIRAIEDVVFNNLALGEAGYAEQDISQILEYRDLLWLLDKGSVRPKVALATLFTRKYSKAPGDDAERVTQSLDKATGDMSASSSNSTRKLEKW